MIKSAVRHSLQGHVWACFGAFLIPQILPLVMMLIPADVGVVRLLVTDWYEIHFSLPMYALSFLATTFVTDPMAVRLAAFFLKLNRDPEGLPSPLSVCDCFGPGYGRLMLGMLGRNLRMIAWTGVPLLIGALLPGSLQTVEREGVTLLRQGGAMPTFVLLSGMGSLFAGLRYSMVSYVLADRPELSPSEAIALGRQIMRGRLWEMLCVTLSFFGWMLLVTMTMMVAGIFVYPYIEATMAAYYIAFSKPLPYESGDPHDAA